VFAARDRVDFRKGFDGLHAIVRDEFGEDALSGNPPCQRERDTFFHPV